MAERRKVRVLYDYTPQNDDELELALGDVIEFLEEVEEGWWKGILKGRMGVFPSNFVGPIDGSPVGKDEPKGVDKDDKRKQQQQQQQQQQQASPKSIATANPNETSSTTTTTAAAVVSNGTPANGLAGLKSKTPLFGGRCDKDTGDKMPSKHSPKNSKLQADPDAPKLPPKPVKELAKVLYSYEAQNDDELTIKEGDTIAILTKEVEDRGWWKGELNGRIGVFPDNFVQLIRTSDDGHCSPQPLTGQSRPERPDKPAKALKPDLPKDKPLMGFNQPLPPLPTEMTGPATSTAAVSTSNAAPTVAAKGELHAGGDKDNKPVSTVSPFGSHDGPVPGLLLGKPILASQIRRQNGAFPALIAAQAAERANLNSGSTSSNNSHQNGNPSHHESPLASATPPGAAAAAAASSSASGTTDNDASALDSIESNEARLKHPTADRARPPARRPPSHIGSPPGHKEATSIIEANGDSLGGPASSVVHLGVINGANGHSAVSGLNGHESDVGKRTSIKDLTSKFVDTNGGPVPQVINLAGKPSNGLATTNVATSSTSSSSSNSSSNINSHRLTSVSRDVVDAERDGDPAARKCSAAFSNEAVQKLETEVVELRIEVKKLRENSVSREEYTNLLAQIIQLQEAIETNRAHYSKMVRELMNEVDEEKKQRMNLQVEIDRLKKITVTV